MILLSLQIYSYILINGNIMIYSNIRDLSNLSVSIISYINNWEYDDIWSQIYPMMIYEAKYYEPKYYRIMILVHDIEEILRFILNPN
jgi:hypothetical protein